MFFQLAGWTVGFSHCFSRSWQVPWEYPSLRWAHSQPWLHQSELLLMSGWPIMTFLKNSGRGRPSPICLEEIKGDWASKPNLAYTCNPSGLSDLWPLWRCGRPDSNQQSSARLFSDLQGCTGPEHTTIGLHSAWLNCKFEMTSSALWRI